MYDSPHCALSGDGAPEFAQNKHFPICDPKELKSDYVSTISHLNYAEYIDSQYGEKPAKEPQKQPDIKDTKSAVAMEQDNCDTVSAVAIDANGHLACATSSGTCRAALSNICFLKNWNNAISNEIIFMQQEHEDHNNHKQHQERQQQPKNSSNNNSSNVNNNTDNNITPA
jgi:hypothetical protein